MLEQKVHQIFIQVDKNSLREFVYETAGELAQERFAEVFSIKSVKPTNGAIEFETRGVTEIAPLTKTVFDVSFSGEQGSEAMKTFWEQVQAWDAILYPEPKRSF